jgi:thiol-disulfide isomerase/thioredoxin
MPKILIGLAAGLVVALAGLALWLDKTDKMERGTKSDQTGLATSAVIYATSFPDVDGKTQSLGQWQNKILVLNFWATWCAPCKEEMPLLAKLQSDFGPKGAQIVGIAADSRQNVANFSKSSPTGYPLLPDEARAMDFAKRLGNRLGLLPYTVVLGPAGDVIFTRMGVVTEAEMRDLFAKNLKK